MEAGRPPCNAAILKCLLGIVKELVNKTASSFANYKSEGGFAVQGVFPSGKVIGIDRLGDGQCNSVKNLDSIFRNNSAEITFHDCQNASRSGPLRDLPLIFFHQFHRDIEDGASVRISSSSFDLSIYRSSWKVQMVCSRPKISNSFDNTGIRRRLL